jgi:peroxiredoxin
LRGKLAEFDRAGARVIVVDPHDAWPARHFLKDVGMEAKDVGFTLLLDPAHVASATYGVAFQMRIHTEISNRPATFVIDRAGVIRYQRRAKSFADRPSTDEILAELKKLP